MPLAGQIDFEITTQDDQLIATLHFETGLPINTWYQFGPTADDDQPHWYEFLYDGSTGAELFDANEDGLVERVELHLVDGQRGDADLLPNGLIEVQAAPATVSDEVTCSVLPADLTCNGFVDFQDLTLLLAAAKATVSRVASVSTRDTATGENRIAVNVHFDRLGRRGRTTLRRADRVNSRPVLRETLLHRLQAAAIDRAMAEQSTSDRVKFVRRRAGRSARL